VPYALSSSKRTDLALEAHEIEYQRDPSQTIPGVDTLLRSTTNTKITKVRITDTIGAQHLGKPLGSYITIEAPDLRLGGHMIGDEVAQILTEELSALTTLAEDDTILVVGLGNWNATPDALGPRVVDNLMVTRHLFEYAPQELRGGLRSVAALAPGVLGLTGIETEEIVRGVVQHIGPDLVIAIDALASRSLHRVSTTVQLADSGIHPGSGVGNKRLGLTKEGLGVPIVAIGVPTVIHASTLAGDALELFSQTLVDNNMVTADELERVLPAQDQTTLLERLLPNRWEDLFVTPKEIDALIADMARIIAGGLNAALHPGIESGAGEHYLK
jgi:spore protease